MHTTEEIAEIQARFNNTAVNKTFGFVLESFGGGKAVVTMPSDSKWTQEEGVIHGGVLMAVADCASGQAILHDQPDETRCASCDMAIKNLLPAWPNKEPLRAVGSVIKRGSRLLFTEAQVYQGERMVAHCTFTVVLFNRK